jgi:hypothetical protein
LYNLKQINQFSDIYKNAEITTHIVSADDKMVEIEYAILPASLLTNSIKNITSFGYSTDTHGQIYPIYINSEGLKQIRINQATGIYEMGLLFDSNEENIISPIITEFQIPKDIDFSLTYGYQI